MQIERDRNRCLLTIRVDPIFVHNQLSGLVLETLRDGDERIVLDLRWVRMLHSPGLAEITRLYVHLAKRGIVLVLAGLNDFNRRLLQTTRLDTVIEIEGEGEGEAAPDT